MTDSTALAPPAASGVENVLEVTDLHTYIGTEDGVVRAVDGVSFSLRQGEILGLVGESGSGKSVACRTLAGLMPSPPAQSVGDVRYSGYPGRNLLELKPTEQQRLRGAHISMIFQDPMSALNPVMRIGDQIEESVGAHEDLSGRERRRRAIELLDRVGIPAPKRRLGDYPHQFSGGMRQRVLIASAIASHPRILLADEPTTALDVIIQDQILSLLLELQRDFGMSMILVSHDLGVIAEMCDRIAVMYGGPDRRADRRADAVDRAASSVHDLAAALASRRGAEEPVPPLDPRYAAATRRRQARVPVRGAVSAVRNRMPNVGDRAARRRRRASGPLSAT